MRAIVIALLSVITMAFTVNAGAQETRRIAVDMGDQVYRGESTIPLKRLIRRQYPNVNFDNWNLLRVRLVAKSRRGRGRASLVVGGWQSYDERIGGRPVDFDWDQPRSFDRIVFQNNARRREGNGRWQIQMRGNIKVRRVVIVAERKRRGGGGVVRTHCASWGDNYNTCEMDGRILDAEIIRKHSNSRCRMNRDWGYRGRTLWVDNGCRADFRVRIRRRF
ncbi:MAG: DUF3011 domain-containing protein [Bdellovibrionales bacterium]|nr:DUF3011 domain-containing protein [Bdellovibrionales bacterium]